MNLPLKNGWFNEGHYETIHILGRENEKCMQFIWETEPREKYLFQQWNFEGQYLSLITRNLHLDFVF